MPGARKTPAHAEIEELESVAARRFVAKIAQHLQLLGQPASPFGQCLGLVETAEVELVDDRQHMDLESHHMHLRAARDDLQSARVVANLDEIALELEDAQEVDEIALDEPKPAQVGQFIRQESQRAQMVDLLVDLGDQMRQRIVVRIAANEDVLGLCLRMPVQHRLPHRELVKVGLEQAVDHGLHGRRDGVRRRCSRGSRAFSIEAMTKCRRPWPGRSK